MPTVGFVVTPLTCVFGFVPRLNFVWFDFWSPLWASIFDFDFVAFVVALFVVVMVSRVVAKVKTFGVE